MKNTKNTILRKNYLRSFTSTLTIVEKYLIELEESTKNTYNACCYEINNDVDIETIDKNKTLIIKAHEQICNLTEKYGIHKKTQSLQRIIDTLQTKMWEVLQDSKSKKIKGFGDFPKEIAKEYDEDIDKLMTIILKISY